MFCFYFQVSFFYYVFVLYLYFSYFKQKMPINGLKLTKSACRRYLRPAAGENRANIKIPILFCFRTFCRGCNNDPKYGTFPAFDGDYFKDCQKSGHQSKNPKGATADAYCCDSNECNSAAVTPRPIPPTPPTTTPKSSSRTSAGFAIGAVVVTAVTAVLAK